MVFAQSALGNYKRVIDSDELESLNELKRGIYLKKPINVGSKIEKRDIYYCMPKQTNQVLSGEFKNGMILQKNKNIDDALLHSEVQFPNNTHNELLYHYVHKVKAMLNYAKINLGNEFNVEYSHHYGVKNFSKIEDVY